MENTISYAVTGKRVSHLFGLLLVVPIVGAWIRSEWFRDYLEVRRQTEHRLVFSAESYRGCICVVWITWAEGSSKGRLYLVPKSYRMKRPSSVSDSAHNLIPQLQLGH